jgi:hypothetical protein
MGKNNKGRRAAKSKSRARARAHRGTGWSTHGSSRRPHFESRWGGGADREPLFTADEQARNLLILTAQSQRRGDSFVTDGLRKLSSLPAAVVDGAAECLLLDQIDAIWAGGWQPAELLRQGRRGCSTAAAGRVVGVGIATDHAGRRSVTIDGRWVAQVEALELPAVNGKPGWIRSWAQREGFDRSQVASTLVDVLANLAWLPKLDPILPPPGSAGSGPADMARHRSDEAVGAETNPVLERIRALLAKAESTTFESEAEAFTAKAQELMTRYAIDAAVVSGQSDQAGSNAERPVAIRVPIDPPYVDAKSLLLQTVAEAGRCRSMFHLNLDLSTVVGFPGDVAAVQMLFTSLLVQAQTALNEAAKKAPAGARPRSQGYRSAFLLAYTNRIGERLREINDAVISEAEAEYGSSFLPVLRSRSAAVDDFIDTRFGETMSAPVRRGRDAAGWAGGRLAADNAQLSFGDLVDET